MGRTYRKFLVASKIYTCEKCSTHLTTENELISTAFHGHHGRAYLFDIVVNVMKADPEERTMRTGRHVVNDISCSRCDTVLGWYYLKAFERDQEYKEGHYILERALVKEISSDSSSKASQISSSDMSDDML